MAGRHALNQKAQRAHRKAEAVPGLVAPPARNEPRPHQIILKSEHAQIRFERALAESMQVERVEALGDAITPALLSRSADKLEKATGRCASGRKALILAGCLQCTQDELIAEDAGEMPSEMTSALCECVTEVVGEDPIAFVAQVAAMAAW